MWTRCWLDFLGSSHRDHFRAIWAALFPLWNSDMLTFQKSDWFIHSKSFNWSLNEVAWKKESKLLTLNALIGSGKSPDGVWVLWMKGWVAPFNFQFPHLCWFCACDDVCTPLYFCMHVPKYVPPKEPAGRKLHGILDVLSSFSPHPSQTWNSFSFHEVDFALPLTRSE